MKQKQSLLRKTAIATMAVSLVAGSATGVMASAKSKHESKAKFKMNLNFKDLNEKEMKWAYSHIIRLAAQGIFNGYEDGQFKPQNKVTRIEAIVAAVRLLGLKEEAEKPENMNAKLNFKDFNDFKKKNAWAVGYLAVALENDLFAETEASIQANKPADRLWASILLVKALKLDAEAKAKMDTQLNFRDAHQIPAGAVGYVAVAVEKDLIKGYNDQTFQPNRPVTRAELAALLDRVDQQLPEDQNAQAITGVVTAVANGTVTVKKADNQTVTVPLASNVFIFRNDVKVPVSALQTGDEVLVRTFEGKAVFIEVTKAAEAVVDFTETGKISTFTLNAEGKIATLSITKDVNGVQQTVIFNVDANVTITGGTGILAPNLNVVVKGTNNVIKTIEIQAQ